MSAPIHPNELTREHVNQRATVVRERTTITGRLGPFLHEIEWVNDLVTSDTEPRFTPGRISTEFWIGPVRLTCETGDGATITLHDDTPETDAA